jgi:aspartyl-tRNA(Asn)/glutamyl-tRNA(Gln) amidotransferase subunit A
MTDHTAWRLSATEMLARFRAGTLTPRAALEACLARLAQVQPVLNAFVAERHDAARAEAEASGERWRAGRPCGVLDGVPLAVKDNLPTADLPTTWGSAALAGHRTGVDELAVARARAAGALIVGKTNVPEFTLEGYTSNRLHGTTRNPWDPRLTPGGSSGGSVAAVAAGAVPLALGTDGGGSIRRPASHTGLVGFKPSIGAIPRENALPQLLLDFEVVGPIARTVADARLLFEALRGPSAGDRRSFAAASAAATRRPLPKPLRVVYAARIGDAPVDEQIALSCRAAALRLAELGHEVTEGELPLDVADVVAQWPQVGQVGLAALFERHPDWRSGAADKYLDMAAQGAAIPAAALWNLLEAVERLRGDAARLFTQIDLIVTPSAAALPWPAEEAYPPEIAGHAVGPRGHAVFTGWVNAAGLPALAVPAAPSPAGLPIGIQLIGDYGGDDALLELGAAFELHTPWAERRPPL